ncbi:ATP-binding cassette domain-containing protein, partial [Rhizobium ecuadorense]
STLLRMIAGLEDITSGELRIGGRVVNDVEPADRGIAMVFQSYALYPHLTVEENLSFGLRMNGNPKADTERRVRHVA